MLGNISELKSRITIIEVADRLGIGIQTNKYGKALCPFHDDKNMLSSSSFKLDIFEKIYSVFYLKTGIAFSSTT